MLIILGLDICVMRMQYIQGGIAVNPTKMMKGLKIGTTEKGSQAKRKFMHGFVLEQFFEMIDEAEQLENNNKATSKSKSILRALTLICFLFLTQSSLVAQTPGCTLSCLHSIDNPASISPDPTSCLLTLSLESPSFVSSNCDDNFNVMVMDVTNGADNGELVYAQQGHMLGSTFTFGPVNLGAIYRVSYFSQEGNACSNYYEVIDAVAPVFDVTSCDETVTVDCSASFDPTDSSQFAPTVEDNCFSNLTITVALTNNDNCINSTLDDGLVRVIERTWTVLDPTFPDDSNTCAQRVEFSAPDLDNDLAFPSDMTIDCGGNTLPEATGLPTIDGEDINLGVLGNCLLSASYVDTEATTPGNCNDVSISRTWTVTYGCDNTITLTGTQIINVVDSQDPVITCPANFTVGTDTQPNVCGATFVLPNATATDNCSNVTIINNVFSLDANSVGNGAYTNVSVGTYTVRYIATDDCGNTSDCDVEITVEDNEGPTAICTEFTNISLNSTGEAVVNACVFDAGQSCTNPDSNDDCYPVSFTASLDNVTFSETLTFDCDDIGQAIPVFMRVTEVGPTSPLSTTCMVSVEIEDKLDPIVICPTNPAPQDCETDFSNLSDFGTPVVIENCDYTLTTDELTDISQCGNGTITRTFSVTDASGATGSCVQTITVENLTPFNNDNDEINFPGNYTEINTCRDPNTLTPEILQPNYVQDILPENVGCSMLAVSYQDMFFNVNAPNCYKIMRTWKVIDWCQYDPDNTSAGGSWSSIQIIKVEDTNAPVFVDVPESIEVGVDDNCVVGQVTNLQVTAMDDCNTSDIMITNDFNDATDGTANGEYPLGNTTVTFTATDGCGNVISTQVVVTVRDLKKPVIACNDNLATDIADMNGGMAMANVDLFIYSATDNCSATADLKYTMKKYDAGAGVATVPPTTTDLVFDCTEEGSVPIEVWVQDQAGNSELCIVNFIIQDNNNVCPDDPSDQPTTGGDAMIAGILQTEMGEEVEEVEVMLMSNSNAIPDITGFEGSFAFPNLPLGLDYTVVPHKEDNYTNGVTTWDIVSLRRHILNIERLSTPYKMIAGDVNNSGSISMADLVSIKRVILGLESEFAGGMSWRFVDMYYEFPDPENPWQDAFPEAVVVSELTDSQMAANFTAIKLGDVNNSAIPNLSSQGVEERTSNTLVFNVPNKEFKTGELFTVSIAVDQIEDVAGFQFGLDYDSAALLFVNAEHTAITQENLLYNANRNGNIAFSWAEAQGVNFRQGETLITLSFKAKTDGTLANAIEVNDKTIRAEAYQVTGTTADMVKYNIELNVNADTESDFVLYQNRPNPFNTETTIAFDLSKKERVALTVYDITGREIYRKTGKFDAGRNEITIYRDDLNVQGVLWYQLSTDTQTATHKMIIQ